MTILIVLNVTAETIPLLPHLLPTVNRCRVTTKTDVPCRGQNEIRPADLS